jgi:hypothetical protein
MPANSEVRRIERRLSLVFNLRGCNTNGSYADAMSSMGARVLVDTASFGEQVAGS